MRLEEEIYSISQHTEFLIKKGKNKLDSYILFLLYPQNTIPRDYLNWFWENTTNKLLVAAEMMCIISLLNDKSLDSF